MIRALYTAASGMSAQQLNLDTIANNLANSSTTGFRQLRLEFQDMVYQNLVTPGAAQSQSTVSAGLQIGLGTKSAATEVIMTQGSLNQTSIRSMWPSRAPDSSRCSGRTAPSPTPAPGSFSSTTREPS